MKPKAKEAPKPYWQLIGERGRPICHAFTEAGRRTLERIAEEAQRDGLDLRIVVSSSSKPKKTYSITGKGDGHFYGHYQGETPEDAVRAMLVDGGCYDDPDMDAWHVSDITK